MIAGMHQDQVETRERRREVRLSRGASVSAVLLNRFDEETTTLRDVQVVNVSAEGLALATGTRVRPGSTLAVTMPRHDGGVCRCKVRVLACTAAGNRTCTLHCVLVEGVMPAALIYNLAA